MVILCVFWAHLLNRKVQTSALICLGYWYPPGFSNQFMLKLGIDVWIIILGSHYPSSSSRCPRSTLRKVLGISNKQLCFTIEKGSIQYGLKHFHPIIWPPNFAFRQEWMGIIIYEKSVVYSDKIQFYSSQWNGSTMCLGHNYRQQNGADPGGRRKKI